MRALCVLIIAACSAPAPPAKPVAKPAPAIAHEGPSWVGVRVDEKPVRIMQVIKGAPGDKAGLKIGDEILTVDGTPIESGPAFVERMKGTRSGQRIAIAIVRGGGKIVLPVTVAPRPESVAQSTLIGKTAPAFAATTLSGPHSTTLADLRGHVVIVDFWATWCGPCTFTIPRLKELHAKHPELRIVGLSSEDPQKLREFIALAGINYSIGHDPEDRISGDYLREGIPMFVVIDKTGVVRSVITGADMDAVEQAVLSLI